MKRHWWSGRNKEKQRQIMTVQKNKKTVELFDTHHRLKSAAVVAHHFKINESSNKDHYGGEKKEISWSYRCNLNYAIRNESLALFVKDLFVSYWKCSFYVGAGLL